MKYHTMSEIDQMMISLKKIFKKEEYECVDDYCIETNIYHYDVAIQFRHDEGFFFSQMQDLIEKWRKKNKVDENVECFFRIEIPPFSRDTNDFSIEISFERT